VTVGEPVGRHVEVGPRVRAHRDDTDLERDPGPIDLLGRLLREVIGDGRGRQAGVGLHAIGDDVGQIDVLGDVRTVRSVVALHEELAARPR